MVATSDSQPPPPTPSRLQFHLLGPVSAWVDGRSVPLGGPRQAAVLARLLLTPRHVVSLDQFADSIWDGPIPNRPDVAIRSYVSNLRRLIEPDRKQRGQDSVLVSVSAGYRLEIDGEQVDWIRYETAVGEARALLQAESYAAAHSLLDGAGLLWQGEPLSGVPDSEFFLAHRNRLEELRAVALECTYEAQLGRGDHLSVAADIEQAIAAHPFRERLTELGMIALYRAGRQSAALALGQQLRERLVDTLGIDPGPHIAAVELQILNHDPALRRGAKPPAGSQAWEPALGASTLHRPGHSAEAWRPGSDVDIEWAPEDQPFVRLPSETGALFGRERELSQLEGLADRSAAGRAAAGRLSLAVVTGESGVGRTALLAAAAQRLADRSIPVVSAAGTDFAAPRFWLWRQILTRFLGGDLQLPEGVDTSRFDCLGALGPAVGAALGLDGDPPAADDEVIMMAVVELVGLLVHDQLTAMVLDDLHLCDQRSIDTLRYLISRLGDRPLVIMASWQQAHLPPDTPRGLRDLAVQPAALRLGLAGLGTTAITQLADHLGSGTDPGEVHDLLEATAGNPALLREMIRLRSAGGPQDGAARRSLQELVTGQVERLGPQALWILAAAATFDGPFLLRWLADTLENPDDGVSAPLPVEPGACHRIVRSAVMAGILTERGETGWFDFRHRAVAEALAETLLAIERAAFQSKWGNRFDGEGHADQALPHLAASPSPVDRERALELGLQLCADGTGYSALSEPMLRTLDGLARADIQSAEGRHAPGRLTCRAAIYLGWRANRHGDRAAGRRWARSALKLALAVTAPSRRQASSDPGCDLQQLGVAALNLAGFSPHPQPGGLLTVDRDRFTVDLLELAVSRLPADSEALPVLEIELEWLSGSLRPSNASLKKVKSLIGETDRHENPRITAMATQTFLRRFGRAIPPKSRMEYVRRALSDDAPLADRLALAFTVHLTMLELGRLNDATSLVRGLWTEAKTLGTETDVDAARVLIIRHLVWTGELTEAEDRLVDQHGTVRSPSSDLAAVHVEQKTELGRLLTREDLLVTAARELTDSSMEPTTKAALFCHVGDVDEAQVQLDQAVERTTIGRTGHLDEDGLARLAIAAYTLQHRAAAAAALEGLTTLGDQILITSNNSIVLGPASYFLGLAASTVGNRNVANQAFDSAVAMALSCGGRPLAIQALVAQAKLAADHAERDDVDALLRQAKELAIGLRLHWLDRQVV